MDAHTTSETGWTAQAGFEIGVRRTLPFSEARTWELLFSPEGLEIWLGGTIRLNEGAPFELDNGTRGEVRVYKPGSHIRLTWQMRGWEKPSTLQIRVIPAATGTTVSFHQENLKTAKERGEMKERWEKVFEKLQQLGG